MFYDKKQQTTKKKPKIKLKIKNSIKNLIKNSNKGGIYFCLLLKFGVELNIIFTEIKY